VPFLLPSSHTPVYRTPLVLRVHVRPRARRRSCTCVPPSFPPLPPLLFSVCCPVLTLYSYSVCCPIRTLSIPIQSTTP
jgi:hypothetical protein